MVINFSINCFSFLSSFYFSSSTGEPEVVPDAQSSQNVRTFEVLRFSYNVKVRDHFQLNICEVAL